MTIKLLDTTLREGSYVVNFHFSKEEIYGIASMLDLSGIDYVEAGHGLGLGAERRFSQGESDNVTLEICQDAIRNTKWGMFFIPGIGSEQDILNASKFGMNFIRIGTNVSEVKESEKYIKLSKDLGLEVFSNFMKTYALPAEGVLTLAELVQNFGSDQVCVVDSAGYMLNSEVSAYVNLLTSNLKIPVGFHGHNNLGLATSNSLIAIQNGAQTIDSSLRGIGRSAGNVATEIVAFLFKRMDIRHDIDTIGLLDVSEKYIDRIIRQHQFTDSLGIINGYSGFHSGFEAKISIFASRYNVDPRQMIIKLTEVDKVNAPDSILEEIGKELCSANKKSYKSNYEVEEISGSEFLLRDFENVISSRLLVSKLKSAAIRTGKKSVLNLVFSASNTPYATGLIYEGQIAVVTSFSIDDFAKYRDFVFECSSEIDYFLLDIELYRNNFSLIQDFTNLEKQILIYDDEHFLSSNLMRLLHSVCGVKNRISVIGQDCFPVSILQMLRLQFQVDPLELVLDVDSPIVGVVGSLFDKKELSSIPNGSILIDYRAGSLTVEDLLLLQKRDVKILRLDTGDALSKEIDMLLYINQNYENNIGEGFYNGVFVSSGNVVCKRGTVIVDNYKSPKRVIGIADGRGQLLSSEDFSATEKLHLREILNYITNS